MKYRITIIAILLLISIINIGIGIVYLPLWACISVEAAFIWGLIYVIIKPIYEEKECIIKQLVALDEKMAKINLQLKEQREDIFNTLTTNHNLALQEIKETKTTLTDYITIATNSVSDTLNNIKESFQKEFKNQYDNIDLSRRAIGTISEQILEHISNESDKINKSLENITYNIENESKNIRLQNEHLSDDIISQFDGQIASIESSIKDSLSEIKDIEKEHCKIINDKIESASHQAGMLADAISSLTEKLSDKSDFIGEQIKRTTEVTKMKIDTVHEALSNHVSTNTSLAVTSLSKNVNIVKQMFIDSINQILKISKEQNDILQNIIMQHGSALQDEIKSSTEHIQAKADSLHNIINHINSEIKNQITLVDEKNSRFIADSIATISDSISAIQQSSKESSLLLIQACKEQNESLEEKVNTISKQNFALLDNLKMSSKQLISNSSSLLVYMNSLTEQSEKISSQIQKQDISTESLLGDIIEQNDILNKSLASVKIQTNNIEEAIHMISEDNSSMKVLEAIKAYIIELQAELKNSISNINNQLLDSQISQETTNNELEKLLVLLRTVLNSLEEKRITQNTGKGLSINKEPDLNRTETIVDAETNNIVVNKYMDGNIIKSTMKDKKGHTLYELEYVNGKIVRSRNFNDKGELNIEQTFYDNGQVHFRNEFGLKGKVTTEFDINGKKK